MPQELDKCYSKNGKFISEQCPYFNAVLLEKLRLRPVGESPMVTQNIQHDCVSKLEQKFQKLNYNFRTSVEL